MSNSLRYEIAFDRPLADVVPAAPALRADPAAGIAAREQELEQALRNAEEKQARFDALLGQVGALLRSLEQAKQDLLAENEEEIVSLSLAVAEKVIQHEIDEGRYRIGEIVKAALGAVKSRGAVLVRVNPRDLETARAALAGVGPEAAAVHVSADTAVPPAGCAVQSEAGNVFSEVASRMARIEKGLLKKDGG